MINIITINYPLNGDKIINTEIDGDETLLDADLVICDPSEFSQLWDDKIRSGNDNVPRLNSPHSDRIRNTFNSRKNEIESLLDNGKIIISFLHPVSGFEGEIGNQSKYDIITNYDFLPFRQDFFLNRLLKGTSSSNGTLKLNKGKSIFSAFFSAFKDVIAYSAYFDFDATDNSEYFVINKSKRPVASIHKVSEGLVVLLPSIPYDKNDSKLIGVLRGCAKKFLNNHIQTPAPPWIKDYKLIGEDDLDKKTAEIQLKIEKLQLEKVKFEDEKNKITKYKGLLFESGTELEELVIEAFQLFGFKAENRKIDDLEHDVVFESKEGKGLAEIEGKDNDAVHISKLDQLNRAVDEDFELTDKYPQGVLIGNHYRLTKPESRKDAFTEKVHIVAVKKNFGLLNTTEIYNAVKFILENPTDIKFKEYCRIQILKTTGKEIRFFEE
jgi:hypothetical protein